MKGNNSGFSHCERNRADIESLRYEAMQKWKENDWRKIAEVQNASPRLPEQSSCVDLSDHRQVIGASTECRHVKLASEPKALSSICSSDLKFPRLINIVNWPGRSIWDS